MPAIQLTARDALVRRDTGWPAKNPGPMVVFCIVFVVGAGLLALFINKKLVARKARKPVG